MTTVRTRFAVDDIMALRPCYSRERVAALWGRRKALTLPQILALNIPATDRMWAGLRLLDTTQRSQVVELIVTRAVMAHCVACGVPSVEAWALDWLSGEDRSRSAASGAARHAAHAAAAVKTAYAAAYAAKAAAEEEEAASSAVAAYAYAASERDQQVHDILTVLGAK